MKRTGQAGAILWAAGLLLALSAGGCGRPLTLVLVEYAGPEAMSSAERVAGELRQQGLKEVFIIGDKTFASVCCGKFTERKDPRAKRLLKRVRQIRDSRGYRPFAFVIGLVPVPEPPIANPWPLEKADGVYTVQVASFGLPGRQNAATAHATKLRKEGWHAYIHHGPTLSTVTIGAYNRDIFDDPRLVLRPDVARQPRIISPAVNSILDAFPVLVIDGQRSRPPVGSQLVEIPHKVLEKELPVLAGLPAPPPKAIFQCRLRLVDLEKEFAPFTARGSARSPSDFFTLVETLVGRLARSATKSAKSRALVRIAVVDVLPANDKAAKSGFAKPATNMVITACYLINKKAVKKGGMPLFARVSQEDVAAALKRAGLTSQEASERPAALRKYLKADYVLTGTVAVIPLVPEKNDEKKGAAE